MQYQLEHAINILQRTPNTLHTLLADLPHEWIHQNEGGDSWSSYDIMGHLIHGEKTDWMPRVNIILSGQKNFEPFDRFAQFENSKGKTLADLLHEFAVLRTQSIEALKAVPVTPKTLAMEGIHPEFGTVTLEQLLSTWVVHDLGHIAQIARVMAKQYKEEVEPWQGYLSILHK